MSRVGDQWSSLWPALAFLLVGVPLAALLDRLGFFEATATVMAGREGRNRPVLGLWVLAALTTVVLNLDTTVVLLTPLYLRLARRAGTEDLLALALIPLLLASLASSVLPVSNLTNLIVTDRFSVGVGTFVGHLALPSFAATVVGWWAYRRRYPTRLPSGPTARPDRHALLVGGLVVAALLVGFALGPSFGIAPWIVVAGADVVLMALTRVVPWRVVPLATAAGVAILAALVAVVVPSDTLTAALGHTRPGALIGLAVGAAGVANLVNNLPALLVGIDGVHRMSWGMWAWLLGVNAGAVLLPIGALANLLWLRIMRTEGLHVGLRLYVKLAVPVAIPAFAAAIVALAAERTLWG
jgi:arsenical pump membrane protein